MAPEMLLKHEYGPIADLWSVGIIAYQCLFGKAPLPSGTCQELVEAVKSQRPIEVSSFFF
jgi:serine/threonine protein kinase